MYYWLIFFLIIIILIAYVYWHGIRIAIYIRRINKGKDKVRIFRPPKPNYVILNRFKGNLLEIALDCLEKEMEKNEVLSVFIEQIPVFLKADSWSFLLTPENDEWRFLSWDKNLDFLPLDQIAKTVKDKGKHIRIILETKSSLFYKDIKKNDFWDPSNKVTISWMGIPIYVDGEIVGVLNIDWFKRRKVSKSERELVEAFSKEISRILTRIFRLNDLLLNSNLDPLTETYNRRALEKYLQNHNVPSHLIGVVFLDIDNFKEINDNFGHIIGDQTLKIIVKRIRNVIDSKDIIFRYGGDEFVLILNNIKIKEDIEKILKRIKSFVSEPITFGEVSLIVSFSAGYAVVPEEAANIQKAIEIADKKMFQEKIT